MGSCYSFDHIAQDHIHTDITPCNFEEPQQKHGPGIVSNRVLDSVDIITRSTYIVGLLITRHIG